MSTKLGRLVLSASAISAIVGPAGAQNAPPKKVITATIISGKPVQMIRPQAMTAAIWKRSVPNRADADRERRTRVREAIREYQDRNPAIRLLNGRSAGDLTPGGDYDIAGSGFGATEGKSFLRYSGRLIPLSIVYWSARSVGVKMPADLTGLADGPAELAVVPVGQAPMTTRAFGFIAAREDVVVRIDDSMFEHLGAGEIKMLLPKPIAIKSPPLSKRMDGEWYRVERRVQDDDRKRCVIPGTDKIYFPGLRNGYDVSSWWYEPIESPGTQKRGNWAFTLEPDGVRIDFGVTRQYLTFTLVHGLGACESIYRIKFVATGPRGLAAQ